MIHRTLSRSFATFALATSAFAACGGTSVSSTGHTCGAGTHEDGSECVGATASGADAAPVPVGGSSSDAATLDAHAKDAGHADASGHDAATIDAESEVDAGPTLTCGPGTHEDNGACLPDEGGLAYYDVRTNATSIGADGISKIPVIGIGRLASGAPSLENVVFGLSRANAGTLTPVSATLSGTGAEIYFTPCNGVATPACLGTFQITMARASAPTSVIATSNTLTLTAPTGVGSPAPCLAGGNVIFFDGDANDYIHPGTETLTLGTFTSSANPNPSAKTVTINYDGASAGTWWNLEFSSAQLNQPLAVGVYNGAERAPFAGVGKPGIDIGGSGRGCNTITGRFQIHEIVQNGSAVSSFTATFEQHCEGGSPALRGCVHFGP